MDTYQEKEETDAFLGMDIDVKPPPDAAAASAGRNKTAGGGGGRRSNPSKRAPAAAAAASRKRPRPPSSSSAAKRPKKPRPPPAPPKSLVSLLRKDDAVRSYFLSLQKNLDYDVDRWKSEATRWKRLANENAAKIANGADAKSSPARKNWSDGKGNVGAPAGEKAVARRSGKGRKNVKQVKRATYRATATTPRSAEKSAPSEQKPKSDDVVETIPITDEALFGDLDSDTSDDDDSDENSSSGSGTQEQEKMPRGDEAIEDASAIDNIEAQKRRRSRTILEKLREAKRCLDALGVSLVEVEVKTTVTTQQQPPMIESADSRKEQSHSSGIVEGGVFLSEREDFSPASLAIDKEVRNERSPPGKDDPAAAAIAADANDNPDDAQSKEDGETTDEIPTPFTHTFIERTLHRQPDEKVAAEMMASLRTLINASSLVGSTSMNAAVAKDGEMSGDEHFLDEVDESQQITKREGMARARLRRRYHPFCGSGGMHVPNVYHSDGDAKDDTDQDGGRGIEAVATVPKQSGDSANNSNGPMSYGEKEGQNDAAMPGHPASIGMRHLMTVLSVMDTYCGDHMEHGEWDAVFAYDGDKSDLPLAEGVELTQEEEEMVTISIGMRNRSRLAERVISSLHVEITRVWALTDRATNLATASVHFHPADVLDMDDPANENVQNEMYGTKSYNRLANLEERIAHARMASLLHRRRGELQKASELVAGYIVSSAPSLGGTEEYPKLPPALSVCVLEALLAPEDYVSGNGMNGGKGPGKSPAEDVQGGWRWFPDQIRHMFVSSHESNRKEDGLAARTLLRALAHPVRVAASVWGERALCSDDRVRDPALVEVAAYDRLLRFDGGGGAPWLTDPIADSDFERMDAERIAKVGKDILGEVTSTSFLDTDYSCSGGLDWMNKKQAVAGISCVACLLTLGDVDQIIQLCNKTLLGLKEADNLESDSGSVTGGMGGRKVKYPHFLLPAYCSAYASLMHRKWETAKLLGGGAEGGRYTAAAFAVEDRFPPLLDEVIEHVAPGNWAKVEVVVQCCVLLGDGRRLQRLANRVLPRLTELVMARPEESGAMTVKQWRNHQRLLSTIITSFIDMGEVPTVRVINLKRRPDRLLDFTGCAVHKEQLIVVQGPAELRSPKSFLSEQKENGKKKGEKEGCPGGCPDDGYFAFDGRCSCEDFEAQVRERCWEGKCNLSDFVKYKWRPSDLKAFDRDAPDHFELVPTSMTERACALSHVASWMGVEGTLSPTGFDNRGEYDHEWYQMKLGRMFHISGFASGPALLRSNEDADPAPVCVILEDDAVLVDRFAERLAALLDELPRDFHFCSLGYSRPKAAPMAEYSTHLGIPSCLWYLTGYVLSLEGARHLIESLPVTGPVDSWIGLKMCANWDNNFGDMLGVGKFTKAKTKLPSRKDLASIIKFRAFAALVPLCAQKVGSTSTSAAMTRGGGWRNRDTDITYSG